MPVGGREATLVEHEQATDPLHPPAGAIAKLVDGPHASTYPEIIANKIRVLTREADRAYALRWDDVIDATNLVRLEVKALNTGQFDETHELHHTIEVVNPEKLPIGHGQAAGHLWPHHHTARVEPIATNGGGEQAKAQPAARHAGCYVPLSPIQRSVHVNMRAIGRRGYTVPIVRASRGMAISYAYLRRRVAAASEHLGRTGALGRDIRKMFDIDAWVELAAYAFVFTSHRKQHELQRDKTWQLIHTMNEFRAWLVQWMHQHGTQTNIPRATSGTVSDISRFPGERLSDGSATGKMLNPVAGMDGDEDASRLFAAEMNDRAAAILDEVDAAWNMLRIHAVSYVPFIWLESPPMQRSAYIGITLAMDAKTPNPPVLSKAWMRSKHAALGQWFGRLLAVYTARVEYHAHPFPPRDPPYSLTIHAMCPDGVVARKIRPLGWLRMLARQTALRAGSREASTKLTGTAKAESRATIDSQWNGHDGNSHPLSDALSSWLVRRAQTCRKLANAISTWLIRGIDTTHPGSSRSGRFRRLVARQWSGIRTRVRSLAASDEREYVMVRTFGNPRYKYYRRTRSERTFTVHFTPGTAAVLQKQEGPEAAVGGRWLGGGKRPVLNGFDDLGRAVGTNLRLRLRGREDYVALLLSLLPVCAVLAFHHTGESPLASEWISFAGASLIAGTLYVSGRPVLRPAFLSRILIGLLLVAAVLWKPISLGVLLAAVVSLGILWGVLWAWLQRASHNENRSGKRAN